MRHDVMGTSSVEEEEIRVAVQSISAEQSSPATLKEEPVCRVLGVPQLATLCLGQLDNYRRGEPCTDTYGLELLYRAIMQGDQEAWAWLQHCFGGLVRGWLRRHPKREVACRLESEEHYVAQTFERFWQATTLSQRVEFTTLAAALQYLRASLNGAILDTLRAYARLREVPLPEPGEPGEPGRENVTASGEVWEILQTVLSGERERRLAYLLYQCGLKPREIIRFCPQEWSDVKEVYRLRRNITERLLHHADQLRWRLS